MQCWQCGEALGELPTPLPRREECPACGRDLHVCKMCEFYDTSVAKSCREPIAEEVKDKERANFCDYLRPRPGAHTPRDAGAAAAARSELDALFGLDSTPASEADPAAEARAKLDALFGDDPKDKS